MPRSSLPETMRPRCGNLWPCSRSADMGGTSRKPKAPDSSAKFPSHGRLLGIDFGTKRVGLALSNPDQTLATPLETVNRRDEPQDARHLQQKVREYSVVGLVVGLPVHMSGDEGALAREARAYGQWAAG